MTHAPGTADKYYQIYDQRENAKPMCQLIATVMEGHVEKSIHWPREAREENNPTSETNEQDPDKTIDYYSSDQEQEFVGPSLFTNDFVDTQEEETDEKEVGSVQPISEVQSIKSRYKQYVRQAVRDDEPITKTLHHRRRSFTDAEASKLITLCETNLASGRITKAAIMDTLYSTEQGRILILELKNKFPGKDYWKMITDRVHTERKRRNKEDQFMFNP